MAGTFFTTEPPGKPNDCSSVVQSKVRELDSSSSVFLSQDGFGFSGSFVFPNTLNFFVLEGKNGMNGESSINIYIHNQV